MHMGIPMDVFIGIYISILLFQLFYVNIMVHISVGVDMDTAQFDCEGKTPLNDCCLQDGHTLKGWSVPIFVFSDSSAWT